VNKPSIFGAYIRANFFQCVAPTSADAVILLHKQALASGVVPGLSEIRPFPVHITKAGQA
jgi:hypothetical protein